MNQRFSLVNDTVHRQIMKGLLFFLLILCYGDVVFANDTSYILLRIKGIEQVSENWNTNHFFQRQMHDAIQHEVRKKEFVVVLAEDSPEVRTSRQFAFVIEINILEVLVNEPIIYQQNSSLSRDITTNTYKDETEDLRKEHATVTADVTITEKSVSGILRIRVATFKLPDVSVVWGDLLVESYKWENKSATYTGSYQALSLKELELIKTKSKPVPKPENVYRDLVHQCINKSSKKIASSLH